MIKFKSVERVNPRDLTAPKKHYALAIAEGSTDLKRLAVLVARQSTVSKADCLAVLSALEVNIIDELEQGRKVHLGDLGTFRISLNSEGVDTAEEVGTSVIKKAKVLFRPGQEMRKMLQTLSYQKTQDQVA